MAVYSDTNIKYSPINLKKPQTNKKQLQHLIQHCFTNASNLIRKAERTSKNIHMTDRTTENFHTWTWRICLLLNIRVFNKPTKSKVVVNRPVQGRKNTERYFPLERKGEHEEKFQFFPEGFLKIAIQSSWTIHWQCLQGLCRDSNKLKHNIHAIFPKLSFCLKTSETKSNFIPQTSRNAQILHWDIISKIINLSKIHLSNFRVLTAVLHTNSLCQFCHF